MATYETKGRLTYKDENSDNHIIYPVTKMDCIEDMPDIEKEVAESVAAYLEDNPVETPDITEQVERAEAAATAAEAAKESVSTSVNLAGGYASSASSSATRAEEAATRAEEAVASIPESGGGTVKTVNGIEPDENGNVEITIPDSGGNVDLTGYATEQFVRDGYQPKGNYLTEHQDISGKLDANKLPEAINDALAQAKESGEFDGADGQDGYTPQKGVDYNDGAAGKSAYQYAKEGGYTGTEAEFSAMLASEGYGYVAQPEPPADTNLLWLDTDDESADDSGAQADWNALEGEPGHVLNRTHYKTVAAIFPETSISWDAGSEMGPTVLLALSESLIVGKEYRIVWNGEEYVRTCFDFNGMAIIGDITPMDADAESTGEPFTILDGMGVQVCMPAAAWSGAEPTGTAILEIITSTVVKIPEEYIPDMQPYQVDMWSEGTSYYTLQTVYALEQAYNSGRQIVLRWAMSLDASSEMIYFFVLEQRLRQDDVVAYGFYNAELNAKIALKPNGMGGFDITRSDT